MEIDLKENINIEKAIESKQTLQIEKIIINSGQNKISKGKQNEILHHVLVVPIISQLQAIGTVIMTANEMDYNFNQNEIELAKTVAEKISNSMKNAKQYSKTEKALNIVSNDLEIGKEIQAGFFPDKIKEIKGWEIFTHFKAARQVSGDFYDVFNIGDSKYTAFVIADVCDKGVGAALFMVLFRSLLRAFSTITNEVSNLQMYLKNIILKTNNYIAETHQSANMFASIFIGILDPDNYDISYINGGLDAPFIINDKGKIISRLLPTGPVIGMFPDMDYEVKSVKLDKGDILFIFTDGTTDAKNVNGEMFSEESLIKAIRHPWTSGLSMLFSLNSMLKNHIGLQDQYDDITQLTIRRKFSTEEVKHSIIREANLNSLKELRDIVETISTHCKFNSDIAFSFKLAAEEICTNIIKYGYAGQETGTIEIEISIEKDFAILKIFDFGKYFPPDEVEIPNIDSDLEDRKIGGLGLALVKGIMDKVSYTKETDNRNQLILEKRLF